MDKALGHPGGEVVAGSGLEVVYVVRGTTGEYSDRSEWLVYAFHTEAEARAYVDLLGIERQKLPPVRGGWASEVQKTMRAFDPQFNEDYTGTSWYVEPLEVQPPTQPPASEDSRAEINRLAERVKELEGALRAILPDAELGTFVSERTYSFDGDHTQPAEMGFSWYWQQTRISQSGEAALREEIDAFLQESAENEVDINVLRARSALNQGTK